MEILDDSEWLWYPSIWPQRLQVSMLHSSSTLRWTAPPPIPHRLVEFESQAFARLVSNRYGRNRRDSWGHLNSTTSTRHILLGMALNRLLVLYPPLNRYNGWRPTAKSADPWSLGSSLRIAQTILHAAVAWKRCSSTSSPSSRFIFRLIAAWGVSPGRILPPIQQNHQSACGLWMNLSFTKEHMCPFRRENKRVSISNSELDESSCVLMCWSTIHHPSSIIHAPFLSMHNIY